MSWSSPRPGPPATPGRRARGSAAGGGGSGAGRPTSAVRRVSLAVVDPSRAGAPTPPPTAGAGRVDAVVDVAALGRPRGLRPRLEGRRPTDGPGPARRPLAGPGRAAGRPARAASGSGACSAGSARTPSRSPPAGPDGLAWTAAPLKVAHPDRPHRLELTVVGGDPAALAVALVAPGRAAEAAARRPRDGGRPSPRARSRSTLSWPIWPDATDPVLVVVNRSPDRPLWLGDAALVELADEPTALPIVGPPGGTRSLAVLLTGPRRPRPLRRRRATTGPTTRWPGPDTWPPTSARSAPRPSSCRRRGPTGPSGRPSTARPSEDPTGPDRRALLLATLGRRGVAAIVEVALDGRGPARPAAARRSPEAEADGPRPARPRRPGRRRRPALQPAPARGPGGPDPTVLASWSDGRCRPARRRPAAARPGPDACRPARHRLRRRDLCPVRPRGDRGRQGARASARPTRRPLRGPAGLPDRPGARSPGSPGDRGRSGPSTPGSPRSLAEAASRGRPC